MMKKEKINFIRAKATKNGIKIFTDKLEDYNRLKDKLRRENTKHYSFKLSQKYV